jgi:DNA-directed RNA polymerase specialized sigma24 family protein
MSNFRWNGPLVTDPSDLEAMYATEDGLGAVDYSFVEVLREDRVTDFDKVKSVLAKLPAREADFLELYFFQRVRQAAIADVFGISQPSVCYRLKRAAARIKYLLTMPDYNRETIEQDLSSVISDPIDVRIMIDMIDTTCQSDVAKAMGVTQGYVRHRFFRTLRALEHMNGMDGYVALFTHVANHLNILKETQQAIWDDPIIFVVS